MELWKELEILRKNRSWLFGKENFEEKIEALNNIDKLGLPRAISHLIPFLKNENIEIRNLTLLVILNLFGKISTKKGFYETLKYADIKENDFILYKNNFSEKHLVIILAIASLNSNGFIREKALKEMIQLQNPFAIQFIIYRLADWVKSVREVAAKGIKEFEKAVFINDLIENIEVFEWLKSVQRVNLNSLYGEIINFIIKQNKNFVTDHFKNFTDNTRIILAKELSKSNELEQKIIQILISDRHFIVRNITLENFEILSQEQINLLLKDKSSKIRFQTLYKLRNQPDFKKVISGYIADRSAIIRDFARFSLKSENLDLSDIYKSNLEKGQHIVGSIGGLAELESREYVYLIEKYLKSSSLKLQKFSFAALTKLDERKAYEFAFDHLDTKNIGLRNLIVSFLSKRSNSSVLEKARKIFEKGDVRLKISMLQLFAKIGKFAAVGDLMIGTMNENEIIRNLSVQLLNQWKQKANSYFISPKAEELEHANQIFRDAYHFHENKKLYFQNPINEIDFYLK